MYHQLTAGIHPWSTNIRNLSKSDVGQFWTKAAHSSFCPRELRAITTQCQRCRFLLSQHPEVEARVVQELQRLGLCASAQRLEPRQLAYADLAELAYLQAVVKVCYIPKRNACMPL